MTRTIEAVYENGMLRPLEPLDELPDKTQVRITIHTRDSSGARVVQCAGSLPDEDAEQIKQIIEREFERIEPDAW